MLQISLFGKTLSVAAMHILEMPTLRLDISSTFCLHRSCCSAKLKIPPLLAQFLSQKTYLSQSRKIKLNEVAIGHLTDDLGGTE